MVSRNNLYPKFRPKLSLILSAVSWDDNTKVICADKELQKKKGGGRGGTWRLVLVVLGAPRALRILLTSTIFVLRNWLKDWATIFTHPPKNINYRPSERERWIITLLVAANTVCTLIRGQIIFLKDWDDSNWLIKMREIKEHLLLFINVVEVWLNLIWWQ